MPRQDQFFDLPSDEAQIVLDDPARFRACGGGQAYAVTVDEAERLHPGLTGDSRQAAVPHIVRPFGFQNPEWERLKASMQPGDEIWLYQSDSGSWGDLAGRAGVVLMRDGREIANIVTMMN